MEKHLNLKKARHASGLTQLELANKVGMGQSHLSKMERGEVWASNEVISVIANTLSIPVSSLLDIDVYKPAEGELRIDSATSIEKNESLNIGLRELAKDKKMCKPFEITADEWRFLSSVYMPYQTNKIGYLTLLITLRGVAKY